MDYSSMQLELFEKCEYPPGMYIRDSIFLKMCPEHSQAIREWTFAQSLSQLQIPKFQYLEADDGHLPVWLEADEQMLDGESSMLNISEAPKETFSCHNGEKRLWIVTDFAETGRCAEKILFECEGLSGNPEQVSEPRKRHSSNIEKSIDTTNRVINEGGNTIVKIRSGKDDGTAGKGALIGYESAFALSCTNDQFLFQNAGETRKIYDVTYDSEARETDVSPTLQARMGTGGNQVPILTENISGVLPFDRQQITSKTNRSNPQFGSVGHTLCGGSACNYGRIVSEFAVRKLTPIECERLQSLPDGWTLIDHKSCTDSARYKALGNGMAQNVPDWILRRLVECVGD